MRARIGDTLSTCPGVRLEPTKLVADDTRFPNVINLFQLLWDGLRTLPYSDDDVASAMGNAAFLATSLIEVFKRGTKSGVSQQVAGLFLKMPQQVEFGRRGGGSATGYVDEDALLGALRPDFTDLLKSDYATIGARGGTVIQVVSVPSRAFVFERFATVFATQVAPTQVMLFQSKAHYFNPFRLESFGLP